MLQTDPTPNKVKQLNVIHLIPRIRLLATHKTVENFHTRKTKCMLAIIKISCWTQLNLFHVQQPISVNLIIKHLEKITLAHLVKIPQLFNLKNPQSTHWTSLEYYPPTHNKVHQSWFLPHFPLQILYRFITSHMCYFSPKC